MKEILKRHVVQMASANKTNQSRSLASAAPAPPAPPSIPPKKTQTDLNCTRKRKKQT
jgi:hypothetical protein